MESILQGQVEDDQPTPEPTYAYGVFQGGGAKGFAHIGALRAAERVGVKFIGIAGASAGAIVASLAAVGYRADELFDLESKRHILADESPVKFFDRRAWRFLKMCRKLERFPEVFRYPIWWICASATFLWWTLRGKSGLLSSLAITEKLNTLLYEKLSANLSKSGAEPLNDRYVRFSDLSRFNIPSSIPLKIIVTDVERNRLLVFSPEGTPDVLVAEAAAASAAVPLLFEPVAIQWRGENKPVHVDGGLSANLPVWVFTEEKRAAARRVDQVLPVIAFAFAEDERRLSGKRFALGTLLIRVARASLATGQNVTRDFIDDLVLVPIKCGLKMLDLDASLDQVCVAVRHAFEEAYDRLRWVLVLRPAAIGSSLGAFCEEASAHFSARSARAHIRASFVEPVRRKHGQSEPINFRVTEAHGFDGDADDRLALDIANLGAPRTFFAREPDVWQVNPGSNGFAKRNFMSKYEHALVRSDLKSAISIPVFLDPETWKLNPAERETPLGVVTLDSDSDLKSLLDDHEAMGRLLGKTRLLAEIFRRNDDARKHA